MRNPLTRTIEILGGTAKDIGKDYTENLQNLITDASTIKSTVIQGANSAKDTFERMRNGSGPIKGLLNWFYTKETETDPFDLEEPDSEFNPGTSFGDDEEDEGPAVLDVKAAKNIARGQSNSMFKIASKIAETQVANTSEIISTINSRTAEMVAATNNINSTLIGISKKLDVIQGYVNARTYAGSDKRKREDSLYDYNGRLTLGSVFEASKQSLANNTALSLASSLKSMSGMGMFTPETVARLIFDWTIGEKQFKALGNQSINQVGSKINNALGQMISDTLEGITRSSGFKKLFGDLHQETRNTNFRSYLKNEYTRNPAVFDGMTRHSIVKIIPEYLKKIHEDLSKESLSINERGELTRGSGKTWVRTMASTLGRGAADYDTISAFTKSSEYSHGVHGNQRAVNTVNKVVTFYYLMYMLNTNQKSLPKEAFDPMSAVSMWVINQSTTALVNDTTQTPDEWRNVITSFIMYNYTKPGRLNQFRGELTQIYENRAMNSLVNQVNDVSDPQNITFENLNVLNETAKLIVTSSLPKQQQQTPPLSGNGNVPNIIGNGPGDVTAVQYDMFDTLADIRNLLAAEVKFNIGSKRFKSIQLSSINGKPLPVLPENDDSVIFDDDLQEAQKQQTQLSKKEQLGLVKGAIVDTGAVIKDSMQGHKATLQAIVTDEDGNEIPIFTTVKNNQYAQKAFDKTKGFGANAKEWIDNRREQFGVFRNSLGDTLKERAYQKASDRLDDALAYANNLGTSKEDDNDRDTVAMISAYMQTAIQNGSADQQEKNRIQELINGIHNQKLKSKLSRSVNSMLDRASWKADLDSNQGKKSGIGKILSMVGLILSPLKLIKTALVAGIPKLIKGIGKVFQKDFEQIRIGFAGLKEGISEYRAAKKERRAELRSTREAASALDEIDIVGAPKSFFGAVRQDIRDSRARKKAERDALTAMDKYYFPEEYEKKPKKPGLWSGIKAVGEVGREAMGDIWSGVKAVGSVGREIGSDIWNNVKGVGSAIKTGVGAVGEVSKEMLTNARHKVLGENLNTYLDERSAERQARKEQKAADKAEMKAGFKEGLGSFGDFVKNFKESAGIGGGAKMKIDGIEEAAQTFTEKALCKIVSFLTGKDESVLSEQLETEKQQLKEQQGDETNTTDENGKIQDPNQENQQTSENNGGSQIVGTLSQQQESGNSEGGGSAGGAVANAVGNAVSNATGEAAEGAAGAVAGAAGSAAGEVAGAVGKLSSLAKIGASLGKIVKSLGTIGMAVLKIVGKAIMMLSGFKTLMKTIDAFKGSIVKIVAAGLKPLNAIFNLVNKVIKPLFATVQNVLKGIMKGVSKILTSVIDVLVPVLNNVLTPVLSALTPVLDVIMNFLEPMFDIVSGVINVAIIPAMGIFKFVLVPVIQRIGYAVKTISGLLEIGFGMLMVPLGSILGGIGTLISILPFGSGASGLAEAGFNMADSGRQMIAQGKSDVKEGVASIINSFIKQFTFQDQSIKEEDTHITNPNAAEIKSVGSVMDGYGSGDSYVNNNSDSHNSIWNISNIYGSGNSQKSYGNALGMSDHGCGPMALADAYSRRTGSSVDGLSMASSMAGSGKYSPTKGTSVGSFMSTSSALGMNLTAGGVTASSLKRATPSNPVTVLGSGSDFGTRSGNNHFMNVIGTDRYGGAYVSNPLTGRVDRRSASTLAGSSVLGLYGSGDTEYYSFPDAVADAISELKGLAGSLLGMFTGKSASDEMAESLEATGNSQNLADVTEQIKKATDEATYNDMVAEAEKLARQDFKNDHPQYKNESDEAYEKRFTKWYTDGMKLKYLEQAGASQVIKDSGSGIDAMTSQWDPNDESSLYNNLISSAKTASEEMIASRTDPYSTSSTMTDSSSGGADSFVDAVAQVFEGMVDTFPTVKYQHSAKGDIRLRDGRTISNVRPDCSGMIGAAVTSMGYKMKGKNPQQMTTYDFDSNTGENSIILNSDGTASTDWQILHFNPLDKRPGDVIINSAAHMGMFIKNNPDNSGRNYGFDGGSTDGIHNSAAAAKNYLNASGSIEGRYNSNVWTQPDTAIDGAGKPNYILRYVKPRTYSGQGAISLDGMLAKHSVWDAYKDRIGVRTFIDAGNTAGMSPAEIATLMSTGIWEDSGAKIFGIKSLNDTTYDVNGQAAKGIMNWIDQDVNYGNTVLDQLKWIHGTYFDQSTNDWRAKVRSNQYDAQDLTAYQQATGRDGFKLKVGDKYGDYINQDLIEGAAHFFRGALVPDKIHTAVGMAENVGTAAAAYNWMLENGFAKYDVSSNTAQKSSILPTLNQISTYAGRATVRTAGSTIQLWDNPSEITGKRLLEIPNGAKLVLLSAGDGWYRTTYNGVTGYIKKDTRIKIDDESDEKTAREAANARAAIDRANAGRSETGNASTGYGLVNSLGDASLLTGNEYNSYTGSTASNDTQLDSMLASQRKRYSMLDDDSRYVYDSLGLITDNGGWGVTFPKGSGWWNFKSKWDSNTKSSAEEKRGAFNTLAKMVKNVFNEPNTQGYNGRTTNATGHRLFRNVEGYDEYGRPTAWQEDWYARQHDGDWNFETVLGDLYNAYWGSGDSNAEIPDISQSTNNAWQDLLFNTNGADQNSNVTINRITVASNSSEQEQRIERLLNNTYNVRAERVEQLLEQILDKMDNPDKTPTNPSTPSMFTNDDIPKAVHRLSQG